MKRGIMIIGHGSRYNYNKWVMDEQKRRLEERGFDNVYVGFNETTYPLVNDVLGRMASVGIDDIVAIPFFIASGLHITRDIPGKLGIPTGSSGGIVDIGGMKVNIRYEQPFGNDPALAEILSERIDELSGGKGKRGIIVVGHGSRLTHNKDTITFQAERLREMGYGDVRCAFNEFNEPFVEDVFDEMAANGSD